SAGGREWDGASFVSLAGPKVGATGGDGHHRMAALPARAVRWLLARKACRPATGNLHRCRLVARREMDVLLRQQRQWLPHLAAAIPGWCARTGNFGGYRRA